MSARALGLDIEAQAEAYLKKQGLATIDRNYSCRFGEVDLVMRDQDCLVFVEVRGRRSQRFGTPAESVTFRKQRRLVAAAHHYIQRRRSGADLPCRFDVVGVHTGVEPAQIEWIRCAFDA